MDDVAADFRAAARIYRRCPRAGVTPRGLIDRMIASVAVRNSACAHDIDMNRVANVVGIQMDDASLRT